VGAGLANQIDPWWTELKSMQIECYK
jgi:hypothetical protein